MTGLMIAPALAMAAVLGAGVPDTPETQLVTYSDLDLRSTEGQARLEQRVRSAADRLCREDDRASPQGGYLNTKCFNAAIADGSQQVQLAVAHQERSGGRGGGDQAGAAVITGASRAAR